MLKYCFLFVSIILCFSLKAQDLGGKLALDDQFNNNNLGWHTENSELRYAQVSGGKLIDSYFNKGFRITNLQTVNFNSSNDYTIHFSMANLNGDASKKYRVVKKRSDGSLRKAWATTPNYGFVWGFKDWNNYNCVIFYNQRTYNEYAVGLYIYNTYCKVYFKENGKETVVKNWTKIPYMGVKTYNYTIQQTGGNNVDVFIGNYSVYSYKGGIFRWYGKKIGPLIGAGAKLSLDYVTFVEKTEHPKTDWTRNSLKVHWGNNGVDEVEGIYENAIRTQRSPKYEVGLIKSEEGYNLIYLSGANNSANWEVGDVKAYLTKTATPNLFKVIWFMADKSLNDDLYIKFSNGQMTLIWTDGVENLYLKLFPTSEIGVNQMGVKSSGSGFAISSNGYIATNYHVVEGATKLTVKGVKGNFFKEYSARVVSIDKNNDLAIIKIEDESFTTLGTLPYSVNLKSQEVGTNVFALGYPLRSSMGDEIKLTNGIISSKSGFQGDITTYQVSVPIQPGNSGGPMFNSKGEVVGIMNAKHVGAENVSYSIKSNYLKLLTNSVYPNLSLASRNSISALSLPQQVKFIKEFVYIIEVN